jgi:CO/xanthine dehydrogenase Mo-binding subunit
MTGSADPTAGWIGSSPLRKEDRPLLTGKSCFVDDLRRPGALHAAILRSPHAHARIRSIDTAAALASPGVLDILTAADLPGDGVRIPIRLWPRDGMERFLQPPLAGDTVRYVGEPVAVVVADSRYRAEDALEAFEVDYEPLPVIVDAAEALRPSATRLHQAADSNLAAQFTLAHGDIDAAFAQADLVVDATINCQRHGAVPLEPRGLVAEIEAHGNRLTVFGAAKIVHINRRILARLLDWPEERIRFVELDVGGGFGGRGEFYPEDFLVPLCAIRTGATVAWTEDRAENLRALNHSREQQHEISLALRSDGTLLAIRDRFLMNTGAYVRTHGSVVPGMTAALLPGPYRWSAYSCTANQVITNKTPAGTYRAPGRYEANFVRERVIDIAARRLGRDPVDLRRQNLVAPDQMPYAVGTLTDGHPVVYDSGDYPTLLTRGVQRFAYPEMLRWRESAAEGRRRGVGIAFFVEKSGIARWEYARVSLTAQGRARVHVGSASVGQGVETVLAQICADTLGLAYERVDVLHGDTDVVPDGMGAFGSRATSLGGAAVMGAATALREQVLALAAEQLEAHTADLLIDSDGVSVRGSPRASVSFGQLLEASRPGPALARHDTPGLSQEFYFDSEQMSFPYGLHCVGVEIDLGTGGIEIARYTIAYDVGRAINPRLVEGQVVGGAAQGVGGALLEELSYDAQGQLLSGSLMDYLIPTACEVSHVDVLVTEDAPTPLTPLGAKGAGEGGTAAAGAAIANAVSDALGAEVLELPITPQRVLELAAGSPRPPSPGRGGSANRAEPGDTDSQTLSGRSG